MSFIKSRLGRLEKAAGEGPCPECGFPPDGPRKIAVINEERPEKSFAGDPDERCKRCGRFLYAVLRVVYDAPAPTRGEGGLVERDVHGH